MEEWGATQPVTPPWKQPQNHRPKKSYLQKTHRFPYTRKLARAVPHRAAATDACFLKESAANSQLGILPYAGVDIAAFEIFKEHLLEEYDSHPPPILILGAGMLSSSIAQFASYPLALVRTRMQVGSSCVVSPLGRPITTKCEDRGMELAAREREEGRGE